MFRFFSMRISSGLRTFALLVLGLMVVATRVEAQNIIGLNIQGPFSIGVSNAITYIMNLTNQMGFTLTITATNTMSGTEFQMGPATTSQGTNSVGSSNVVFNLGSMTNLQVVTMTMSVTPTSVGYLTNLPSAATNGVFFGFATNFVVQVTNAIPVADLTVAMTGPASQVFTNDWMVYGVNVTNLGPGTAPSVLLTNTLPPGVGFKSVSPALTRLGSGSNVVFNLGMLASGAFTNLHLTVQPTNAGTLTFVSVVGTNGIFDPNSANNLTNISVNVSNFLSNPGQLTTTIVSTQQFNQLSGRLEQNIVLSNAGPTSVDSARVIVTGLTNRLSNAMGTNNGNPYVTYASTLTNGQGGAYLLLQFYPNQSAFPFTNSQMQAEGVTMPDLAPAASGLMPTNILLMARLPSGGIFLEFPSLTNRAYTVEYSSNLLNWLAAQPLTVTPANYTSWIDYGPPTTVSHPTNTPMRFYRVFLNP
jgi:uncharacterized repeat protein (TIGR01451 family)